MGNEVSSSIVPPPLSINDCLIDGELDLMRYYIYRRRVRTQSLQSKLFKEIIGCKRKLCKAMSPTSNTSTRKKKIKRRMKKRNLWIRASDGTLKAMQPTDTMWYKLYVEEPIISMHLKKLFRNWFRLPYKIFLIYYLT